MLRLARAQAALGIETRLLAGDATLQDIALARQFGFDPDVLQMHTEIGHSARQWTPDPVLARWLGERLDSVDLVHAHMFGAWWAATRSAPKGVPSAGAGWAGPTRATDRLAYRRSRLERRARLTAARPGLARGPGELAASAQAPLDQNAEVLRDVHRRQLLESRPDLELELGRIRRRFESRVHRVGQFLNELIVREDVRRQSRVVDVMRAGRGRCHAATMARFPGHQGPAQASAPAGKRGPTRCSPSVHPLVAG